MLKELLKTRRTKRELAALTGVDEREVRRRIKKTAEELPVISLSDAERPGYKLALKRADYNDAKRAYLELRSRRTELRKRERQLMIFCQLVESGGTDDEIANHYDY